MAPTARTHTSPPAARKLPARTDSLPAPAAGGVLAVGHDVVPGRAAAVREWYLRERQMARLALPGFLEARRYDRVSGAGADVLGMYEVSSPQALASEPYLQSLAAPSRWTRDVMPWFRNTAIAAASVALEDGAGEGGHLATLAGTGAALPRARAAALCRQLLAQPGVLRVRTLAAARGAVGSECNEAALRTGRDAQVAWAVLADAENAEAAQTALWSAREHWGGSDPAQCAIYRLAYCARNTP